MASTVNELVVEISADVDDLKKGFDEADKKVNSTTSSMNSSVERSKKVIAGFAVAAAAAMVAVGTSMVKESLAAIDAQAKFADRIGISIQALAGLQMAAELTGVANSQLNLGLQRMTRRVAEAAQGTGEAVKALAELGLSARELNSLTVDQQFNKIAGAMNQVKGQSDRVRLAMKLFDSEGVALVNTLKLGEKGLNDIAEETKRFGNAISRVDAAKIEAVHDEFTRMGAALDGLGNEITLGLSDSLKSSAMWATELIVRMREILAIGQKTSLETIVSTKGLKEIQGEMASITKMAAELKAERAELIKGGDVSRAKELAAEVGKLSSRYKELTLAASGLTKGFEAKALKGILPPKAEDTSGTTAPTANAKDIKAAADEEKKLLQIRRELSIQSGGGIGSSEQQASIAQMEERNAAISALQSASNEEKQRLLAESSKLAEEQLTALHEKQLSLEEMNNQAVLDKRAGRFISEQQQEIEAAQISQDLKTQALQKELEMFLGNEDLKGAERERREEDLQAKILENAEARNTLIQQSMENENLTYEQALAKQVELWDEAERRKAEITSQSTKQISDIKKAAILNDLKDQALSYATTQTNSKKLFEIGKKAQIADALVNGYGAVQKALNNPFPYNIAAAAAVALKTTQQINAIRSTSFGGGGGAPSLSGGGVPTNTGQGAQSQQATAAAPTQRPIQITISGSGFSGEDIRNLIDQINNEQANGNATINGVGS